MEYAPGVCCLVLLETTTTGVHPNFWRFLLHLPHQLDPTLGNYDFGDAFCLHLLGVFDTTRWTEECTSFREIHHVLLVHHPTNVIDCDNSLLDDCQWILGSLSNCFCVLLGTSIELDGAHRALAGLPPSIFTEEWNLALDLYFHLLALDHHPLFLGNWQRCTLWWLFFRQRMSYLQCLWLEWTRIGARLPRRCFRGPGGGTPLLRWSCPLPWPVWGSYRRASNSHRRGESGWRWMKQVNMKAKQPNFLELDLILSFVAQIHLSFVLVLSNWTGLGLSCLALNVAEFLLFWLLKLPDFQQCTVFCNFDVSESPQALGEKVATGLVRRSPPKMGWFWMILIYFDYDYHWCLAGWRNFILVAHVYIYYYIIYIIAYYILVYVLQFQYTSIYIYHIYIYINIYICTLYRNAPRSPFRKTQPCIYGFLRTVQGTLVKAKGTRKLFADGNSVVKFYLQDNGFPLPLYNRYIPGP